MPETGAGEKKPNVAAQTPAEAATSPAIATTLQVTSPPVQQYNPLSLESLEEAVIGLNTRLEKLEKLFSNDVVDQLDPEVTKEFLRQLINSLKVEFVKSKTPTTVPPPSPQEKPIIPRSEDLEIS
jgi:hypothetical protein